MLPLSETIWWSRCTACSSPPITCGVCELPGPLCPQCFRLSRDAGAFLAGHPQTHVPEMGFCLDVEIAPLVLALNQRGFRTFSSCQGRDNDPGFMRAHLVVESREAFEDLWLRAIHQALAERDATPTDDESRRRAASMRYGRVRGLSRGPESIWVLERSYFGREEDGLEIGTTLWLPTDDLGWFTEFVLTQPPFQ